MLAQVNGRLITNVALRIYGVRHHNPHVSLVGYLRSGETVLLQSCWPSASKRDFDRLYTTYNNLIDTFDYRP